MKVVNLQAENFKILRAIEIAPDGNIVTIAGENGAGKSSVLDAIWVALAGKSVAPPKPVRSGEEKATIRLDLGELVITRTFTDKGGGKITDTVKVESADGLRYPSPQSMLDDLMGAIGFDPFEFTKLKPDAQAETLLELVPLPIDLDQHAQLDASDYAKRRDVNRDIDYLKGQIAGIPKEEVPAEIPDKNALINQLGEAANTNAALQREIDRRSASRATIDRILDSASVAKETAERLRREAEEADQEAARLETDANDRKEELDALPAVEPFVDTDELREQIREAEALATVKQRQDRRVMLEAELANLEQRSEGYTEAMKAREREREEALAKARMPIEGLGFQINEKGKPVVTFGGQPFEQVSTAEQIRASCAIAMASNPQLRVIRIKDGSLLSNASLNAIAAMAEAEDFQIWIERVADGGPMGIVIENGEIVAAPAEPEKESAQ